MFPEDQIEELKALYAGMSVGQEGNSTFILIPKMAMPEGCSPAFTDALFCPYPRDGYPARLFFADKVKNGPNWNTTTRILERNWHAYSWQFEKGKDGRLAQVLALILRGLR